MADVQDHQAHSPTAKQNPHAGTTPRGFEPNAQVGRPPVGEPIATPLAGPPPPQVPKGQRNRWVLAVLLVSCVVAIALAWKFASPVEESEIAPIEEGEFHVE